MCLFASVRGYLRFPKTKNHLIPAILDGSLGGSQTGDGHPEGRAGDVVQTDLVAELNGSRIAAVLTADTAVK